jgi:hypothetical protein
MKKIFCEIVLLFLFAALSYGTAGAVYGIPDQIPSATLVVPLMEKGIATSHATNTVVVNTCTPQTIHYEVWDIDGNLTDIYGNVTIVGSWVSDFGSLLASATPAQRAQLTDGSFYHGFMTIDVVTSPTTLSPLDGPYPFSSNNCLTGFTYYVRLIEGSANGIPMVHIEGGVSSGLSANVRGFYQSGDDREEIDNHARFYARRTTAGLSVIDDPDGVLDTIINRVFLNGNGESRILIWAWGAPRWGANVSPSAIGGFFPYKHYNEAGDLVLDATVNLNHIVNIFNVPGDQNGDVWIHNLPEDFNVYAFTFNSAFYALNPALTWDVMFESTIIE